MRARGRHADLALVGPREGEEPLGAEVEAAGAAVADPRVDGRQRRGELAAVGAEPAPGAGRERRAVRVEAVEVAEDGAAAQREHLVPVPVEVARDALVEEERVDAVLGRDDLGLRRRASGEEATGEDDECEEE